VGDEEEEHEGPAQQESPQEALPHRPGQLAAHQVNARCPRRPVECRQVTEKGLLPELLSRILQIGEEVIPVSVPDQVPLHHPPQGRGCETVDCFPHRRGFRILEPGQPIQKRFKGLARETVALQGRCRLRLHAIRTAALCQGIQYPALRRLPVQHPLQRGPGNNLSLSPVSLRKFAYPAPPRQDFFQVFPVNSHQHLLRTETQVLLHLLLRQERLRAFRLEVLQFPLETQEKGGDQKGDRKDQGKGGHRPAPSAAEGPEPAESEAGKRSVDGTGESTFDEHQQGRKEQEGGVEGKENAEPHQEAQFGQSPHVGDHQGQKRQRRGHRGGKDAVTGIHHRQTDGFPRIAPRGFFSAESVIEVDGVVGAEADDKGGKGKGDDVDGGEEQPRGSQRQDHAVGEYQGDQKGRQEAAIGEEEKPEHHEQRRHDAGHDVLLHHRFVDDRGERGAGAGDVHPGARAGLVDAGHQLPCECHVVHRPRRFRDHDQEPAVPGKEIGGFGVEIEGLARRFQAGQHQVAQGERVGRNQVPHPHPHLARQFGSRPGEGGIHGPRFESLPVRSGVGRVEEELGMGDGIADKAGE